MAAEEEMVSLISTTPVKALGSAADIVVQLLRFLNDTHISSATGRVVKGVSGAAASAGKGAYNAATRGIEGLGREGTVSMHVLRRVADEAGVDSRLVPVPKDFMGALAKEHNLDDDAMWSVVKKRLTEAGIMHAVVRTSDGTLGVQVLSGTQSGVAACLDQLKGGLNAALAGVGTEGQIAAAARERIRTDVSGPYPESFRYLDSDFSRDKVLSNDLGRDAWSAKRSIDGQAYTQSVWLDDAGRGCYRLVGSKVGVIKEDNGIGSAAEAIEEAVCVSGDYLSAYAREHALMVEKARAMEAEGATIKKRAAAQKDNESAGVSRGVPTPAASGSRTSAQRSPDTVKASAAEALAKQRKAQKKAEPKAAPKKSPANGRSL